jgi:hypothetical protein
VKQDDRAPFDRALLRARTSAYPAESWLGGWAAGSDWHRAAALYDLHREL